MAGNEFDFITWIRDQLPGREDVSIGIGDDAALVRAPIGEMLLKVDSLGEGVHFQLDDPAAIGFLTPELAGRKALARALSDIAAMGGLPHYALVAGTLGPQRGLDFAKEVMRGLIDCAEAHDVALVGGETTAWPSSGPMLLSVTLVGAVSGQALKRSSAAVGETIYVTGALGGSIHGRHATFTPRLAEGQWLAANGVSCAMDLSDGLEGDLRHILKASKVGARIDLEHLPIHDDLPLQGDQAIKAALCDGEDYELLFTLPQSKQESFEAAWPFDTSLTAIGEIVDAKMGLSAYLRGQNVDIQSGAWRHDLG